MWIVCRSRSNSVLTSSCMKLPSLNISKFSKPNNSPFLFFSLSTPLNIEGCALPSTLPPRVCFLSWTLYTWRAYICSSMVPLATSRITSTSFACPIRYDRSWACSSYEGFQFTVVEKLCSDREKNMRNWQIVKYIGLTIKDDHFVCCLKRGRVSKMNVCVSLNNHLAQNSIDTCCEIQTESASPDDNIITIRWAMAHKK